jgi:hypothetical protein
LEVVRSNYDRSKRQDVGRDDRDFVFVCLCPMNDGGRGDAVVVTWWNVYGDSRRCCNDGLIVREDGGRDRCGRMVGCRFGGEIAWRSSCVGLTRSEAKSRLNRRLVVALVLCFYFAHSIFSVSRDHKSANKNIPSRNNVMDFHLR